MPLQEDYQVTLDAFHGPLDLLLYLIRRAEVDIHDIPIAQITQQYLALLKRLDHIDVDAAGEFLVMAATLIEIKSRTLVPLEAEGADDLGRAREQGDDARGGDFGWRGLGHGASAITAKARCGTWSGCSGKSAARSAASARSKAATRASARLPPTPALARMRPRQASWL